MNYTDDQLKKALTKMLPDCIHENGDLYFYDAGLGGHYQVRDTELLHLCWLLEKDLTSSEIEDESEIEWLACHASWQNRVIALAKVKGIEI